MKDLASWAQKEGRKPLIINGVRQVGKTYLMKQLGQRHFKKFHVINFEKQLSAHSLFEKDLNPKQIIKDLSFFLSSSIDIDNDLVIFDEIQACPKALTSLKYFYEDLPQLSLVSAGSLLGVQLNDSPYPVGKVDLLHLHPMSFLEFLRGIGDHSSADLIENSSAPEEIPEAIHQHIWERSKQYFVTGGLPEVVSVFAEKQENLFEATQAARTKQNQLIEGYYADIAKHSGKINAMHIDRTWRAIPKQLASTLDGSANRFKFKDIISGMRRHTQFVGVIDWLKSAGLIIQVPMIEHIKQPLSAFAKENQYKLFLFDVGILGAMSGLNPAVILKYDYGTYKGYFAENFVAQQLLTTKTNNLFSWHKGRAEVEFVVQHKDGVVPIEVKPGSVVKAQSLQKYIDSFSPEHSVIFSARPYKNNLTYNSHVLHLPLYTAEKWMDWLN